jgi:glycosyltransferase family protein
LSNSIKNNLQSFFRNLLTRLLAAFFPLVQRLYPFPQVASIDETLDALLVGRKSICRYGDGEFLYMLDEKELPFQYFDRGLAKRLREVIRSNDPNILVALPIGFHSLAELTPEGRLFWKSRIVWLYPRLRKLLLPGKAYYNAHMTRLYHDLMDKNTSARYIAKIRQLWEGRELVIIEGEKSRLGLGNDLFAHAASVQRMVAPAHHAYSQFEPIVAHVQANSSPNSLILVALGPTATVMTYALAKAGYQAIDIGNIDIEYEWYLRKSAEKIKIPFKYTGEAEGGREVEEASDALYASQIMARFGVAPPKKTTYNKPEIGWLLYGSNPVKRAQMLAWQTDLGIERAYIVNNHPQQQLPDEKPGTNEQYEFSAYEELLQSFEGPGPFVLVNDTLFRNHGNELWKRLVQHSLLANTAYPYLWGDWRSEKIVFPEKPATYLASWIFVIPDRATLVAFQSALACILHTPLPEPSADYVHYVRNWLQSDKWFSGWHGPGDPTTLARKQRTVRLEHALSIELRKRGLFLKSLGQHQRALYFWTRIYDRLRTRWMALFNPLAQ